MRFFEKMRNFAREHVFPSGCPLCGRVLLSPQEAYYGLCAECAEHFPLEYVPRCQRCGKPLISEIDLCITCKQEKNWSFDAAVAIYPYIGEFRELLKAYKFGKFRTLAAFLAEKLILACDLLPAEASNAVWVPVPPRAGKLKQTLWDQIEELARILEHRTGSGITISRPLRRLHSKTQKELDREGRINNLRGKIIVKGPVAQEIILFDDVFTTGSTLSVCAEALKSAGAQKVWGLCLFYD
ncbi:MAG: ComF family protein [Spirochaetaceae bacterium]|jgi:ComF family protein|nr:ComF family protein [Spirochaetaceae bacterium]